MTADTLKVALVQTRTPAEQTAALAHAKPLISQAAATGAEFILLPECANLMEARKAEKALVVTTEEADVFVTGVRQLAVELKVPILIGSAILRSESDDRAVNRTLLIDVEGNITARYDKIHLFDADTPDGKSYRESASVKPGERAVVAKRHGAEWA